MKLIINGKEENVADNEQLSLSKLLTLKDVKFPQMVSVQLNGEFVKTDLYESKILKENDNVEFLYFMGGGR
ncbi:MAG: sulfur carrier protein ThiS [Epsilonproteobacteria bacterium]|nr:sulfur carrier protein ThiS [Campylobacterota bacterium]